MKQTFRSIVSLLLRHGMCTKPSSVAIFAFARTHSLRLIKLLLFSLDSSIRCLSWAFESSYRSLPARLDGNKRKLEKHEPMDLLDEQKLTRLRKRQELVRDSDREYSMTATRGRVSQSSGYSPSIHNVSHMWGKSK